MKRGLKVEDEKFIQIQGLLDARITPMKRGLKGFTSRGLAGKPEPMQGLPR